MLQNVLQIIQAGWQHLRRHSELWFVAVLAAVLPLLVVISAHTTLRTATEVMVSIEKSRVATIQSAAGALLQAASSSAGYLAVQQFLLAQPGVVAVQIAIPQSDGTLLSVLGSSTSPVSERTDFFHLYRGRPNETFISEFVVSSRRIWYAYHAVVVADTTYVFETVYDMRALDLRLERRLYETYSVIALVILLIVALAYWMARQVDYRARYHECQAQLREHEQFTGIIVHELRAPLTAIRGYASMIEEDTTLPATIRSYGEQIKRSAIRLIALVGDYLEVTRLRSGAGTLERTQLEIVKVVQSVLRELEPLAHDKHLTMSVTTNKPAVTLLSNHKHLTQALTNLVSNAIKYTPRGHIEVVIVDESYSVEIRIADTGRGMTADDQKRLFSAFSRVGDDESKQITGSGLGLWITKLLVEQLGGSIGVESIKGVGTHIVMRFKKR